MSTSRTGPDCLKVPGVGEHQSAREHATLPRAQARREPSTDQVVQLIFEAVYGGGGRVVSTVAMFAPRGVKTGRREDGR